MLEPSSISRPRVFRSGDADISVCAERREAPSTVLCLDITERRAIYAPRVFPPVK